MNGIIDAHHHLWDTALRDYPWMVGLPELQREFSAQHLREALAGTPVLGTVVVQALSSDEETDWLVRQAAAIPEIVGVVAWADLVAPGIVDRLSGLVAMGPQVRGIRHQVHDEPDPRWIARPDVLGGLAAVGQAGLVFDLLIRARETAAAVDAVRALPELAFVVDHAVKPDIAAGDFDGWRARLGLLAAHENVSCKISGLTTEASRDTWRTQGIERYVEAVFELFGPERCMFGSDWPVSLLASDYREVLALAEAASAVLSPGEREAFFAGTAIRTYRLPPVSLP